MEGKRITIITLAWIILLCISSGYCSDNCPYPSDKDGPPSTTCNPKNFDCNLFNNDVFDYKEKLEPLNEKILSNQELSSEELEDGIKIVNGYYTRLIDTDILNGKLGKDVVNDQGDFAKLANSHLKYRAKVEGKSDQIIENISNNLRISLAYNDAKLRLQCPKYVTYGAIAKYHYYVFEQQGLSKLAWGGALFEEFTGSGSWMNLGGYDASIPFKAGGLVAAIACNRDNDGIKARDAALSIVHTPATNPLPSVRVLIYRIRRFFRNFKPIRNLPWRRYGRNLAPNHHLDNLKKYYVLQKY